MTKTKGDKMNKLELIKWLLDGEDKKSQSGCTPTFLEIGKPYLVRTVTMIYTGRLEAFNEQEFLFSDVAWIPETERWMDTVTKAVVKECEPYGDKKVTIGRGALLDAVEIPELIRKQK